MAVYPALANVTANHRSRFWISIDLNEHTSSLTILITLITETGLSILYRATSNSKSQNMAFMKILLPSNTQGNSSPLQIIYHMHHRMYIPETTCISTASIRFFLVFNSSIHGKSKEMVFIPSARGNKLMALQDAHKFEE